MTATNQNFTMYAGDSKNLILPVEGVTDLSGATVKWGLRKRESSTENILLKDSTESMDITMQGNEITIRLKPLDTENLGGTYFHECELTDQQDNVSTIMVGLATINRSGV